MIWGIFWRAIIITFLGSIYLFAASLFPYIVLYILITVGVIALSWWWWEINNG